MRKIVIDAGHGGHDSGAIGSGTTEAKVVLEIALKLKKYLEKDYKVILTRNNDTFVNLYSRSVKSNVAKADIFVSLHLNSAKSSSANGFETFIFNGKVSNNTIKLQDNIHREILKAFKIRDRGKKRGNFSVLRETVAPAVLIEYGFINNPNEGSKIKNNTELLARATANGINAYFGKKTTTNNKGELTMTQYAELKNMIEKLQNETVSKPLSASLQDDAKLLFKKAYDEAIFTVNHASRVKDMTEQEALTLLLRYVARKEQ